MVVWLSKLNDNYIEMKLFQFLLYYLFNSYKFGLKYRKSSEPVEIYYGFILLNDIFLKEVNYGLGYTLYLNCTQY